VSVRRLITDADLRAGRVSGPIVLDEGTLITPAARDRAAALGIPIVERGAAVASAGGAAAPTCSRCGSGMQPVDPGCAGCGASPCACPGHGVSASDAVGPSCGAGTPAALGDGLWLVRVVDGRPVSVLPAAGAGALRAARRE